MKAKLLLFVLTIWLAAANVWATTITIAGTFHYGFQGSGPAQSYLIQFVYDQSVPLTFLPQGTLYPDTLKPLYDDFYAVPATALSEVYMQIGNSPWLPALTHDFIIDGDIGIAGTGVHYMLGGFSSTAGRVSIGTAYSGGGKTWIWDDVFVTHGGKQGFAPGEYSIKVVPDSGSTGLLAALALAGLSLVDLRRRKALFFR